MNLEKCVEQKIHPLLGYQAPDMQETLGNARWRISQFLQYILGTRHGIGVGRITGYEYSTGGDAIAGVEPSGGIHVVDVRIDFPEIIRTHLESRTPEQPFKCGRALRLDPRRGIIRCCSRQLPYRRRIVRHLEWDRLEYELDPDDQSGQRECGRTGKSRRGQ